MASPKVPKIKGQSRTSKALTFFLGVKDNASKEIEGIEAHQKRLNQMFLAGVDSLRNMVKNLDSFGDASSKVTSRFVQRFGSSRKEIRNLRYDLMQAGKDYVGLFSADELEGMIGSLVDAGATVKELRGEFKQLPLLMGTIKSATGANDTAIAESSISLMRYQKFSQEQIAQLAVGFKEVASITSVSAADMIDNLKSSAQSMSAFLLKLNAEQKNSALGSVAALSGFLGQLGDGGKEMTNIIAEAVGGNQAYFEKAIKLTGLDMNQLRNLFLKGDISTILESMSNRIGMVQGSTETAIATFSEQMGFSKDSLAAFMNEFPKMRNEASKVSSSMFNSGNAVGQLKNLADESLTTWQKFSNEIGLLGGQRLPLLGVSLKEVAEGFNTMGIVPIAQGIGGVVAGIANMVIVCNALGVSLKVVGNEAAFAWLKVAGPIGILIALIGVLMYVIWKNWDSIKEIFSMLIDFVVSAFQLWWDTFKKYNIFSLIYNGIVWVIDNWDWLVDKLWQGIQFLGKVFLYSNPLGWLILGIMKVIEYWDVIQNALVTGINFVKDAFMYVFDLLAAPFKKIWGFFQSIGGWVSGLFGGKSVEANIDVSKSVKTTPVPAMASGGIVSKPTVALVGERGPEAVVPLNQNVVKGSGVMKVEDDRLLMAIRDLTVRLDRVLVHNDRVDLLSQSVWAKG